MVIGGYNGSQLDDVELISLEPKLSPLKDCLTQLNPLPEPTENAVGALDYSRKSLI